MGHGAKDCEEISLKDRLKEEDDLPYSNALKDESTMMGKECFKFGLLAKKSVR